MSLSFEDLITDVKADPDQPPGVWIIKTEDVSSGGPNIYTLNSVQESNTIYVCPINDRDNKKPNISTPGNDRSFQRLDGLQRGAGKRGSELGSILLVSQQNREHPEIFLPQVQRSIHSAGAANSAVEILNLGTDNSDGDHSNSSSSSDSLYDEHSCSTSSDKKTMRKNRVRLSVLDESLRYRHIRQLNNLASKRLRERKKREKEQLFTQLTHLEKENYKLKKHMETLEMKKELLRSLMLGR